MPFSSKAIDLAAQQGECEAAQLRLRHDGTDMRDVSVAFSALTLRDEAAVTAGSQAQAPPLEPSFWSAYQVGYVNCTVTQFCQTVSGPLCGGWKPDPLLPLVAPSTEALDDDDDARPTSAGAGGPAVVPLIPSGHTQPIFVEVCIPRAGVAAGNYTGRLTVTIGSGGGGEHADYHGGSGANSAAGTGAVTTFDVPIALEVWPIVIPAVNSSDAWPMVFSFTPDMRAQYASWKPGSAIMRTWYDFQAAHRMPADYLYGGDFAENIYQPYPDADFRDPAEYPVLADSGAWGANLLDVSNCEKNCTLKPKESCVCPWPQPEMMAATTKQLNDVTAALTAADSVATRRILHCSSPAGGNCTKGLYVYRLLASS